MITILRSWFTFNDQDPTQLFEEQSDFSRYQLYLFTFDDDFYFSSTYFLPKINPLKPLSKSSKSRHLPLKKIHSHFHPTPTTYENSLTKYINTPSNKKVTEFKWGWLYLLICYRVCYRVVRGWGVFCLLYTTNGCDNS